MNADSSLASDVPVMLPKAPSAEAALARLRAVDASGWYSNFGEQECELRSRFAERFCVADDQVATAANATLAIAGAVSALGGQRWLVPAFTFAATPAAVLLAGSSVVFGDIDARTWVLAPNSRDIDGFLPVAPFGAVPDIVGWSRHERVVHDAAASIGEPIDLSSLPPGHAVVFSLHATKVLGAGEGGVVVFGDADRARRFRSWTNFGFGESRESVTSGTNAKMSEVQCAYAHAALDAWRSEREEWLEARTRVVAMADRSRLALFGPSRTGINPYAIAMFDDHQVADRVEQALARSSIGARRWWSRGCHRMPAFQHLAVRAFPASDEAAAVSLGLPMFRGISDDQLERVESALRTVL